MKKDIFLFKLSFSLFIISAISILLSFFGSYKDGNAAEVFFAVLTGILFWGGLAAAIVALLILNSHRKSFEHKHRERNKNTFSIGIITFFSNGAAKIADVIMIALIIIFAAIMFILAVGMSVKIIVFAPMLASIYAHSMLNGMNYKYILKLNKRSVE